MKQIIPILIAITILMLGNSYAAAQDEPEPDPSLASPHRMDLVVPDDIWNDVLAQVNHEGGPLGYSADQMASFGIGSTHILGSVESLFRNVTDVPRFSGLFGNQLLSSNDNFANTTFRAYRLLDAYGGRVMSYGPAGAWEADWIPEEATADEAFELIFEHAMDAGYPHPIYNDDLVEFGMLPDEIKLLAARVIVAATESYPILMEAWNEDFLTGYFNVDSLGDIPYDALYDFACHPYQDTEELTPRESFDALDEFDMKYFGTGSNEFMRMTYAAILSYTTAIEENPVSFGDFTKCEFYSPMGPVGIFGPGADSIEGEYFLVIDLGGDDIYTGRTAVPLNMEKPYGVVIDLDGDDVYDGGDEPASLACGNHGIGAIFDLDGDDSYTCDEAGIGSAFYGTGLVVDYAGDDNYYSRKWGQGNAYAGVGMLMDLGGDDYYGCIIHSQAHAMVLGCGVIVDSTGNDTYYADPRGDISELYEGRTCNFAQGASYGRRADFGDGHSLGGGIAMLADGDGDDSYTGSCYVQGAAYWWALGMLEDRAGNDSYACEQYSLGASPHFGIGCVTDLAGDDKYNIGNEAIERQYQAHARDGAFGIFIDGSGNDEYYLCNLCAGSSDLNSLTFFWDRMGDDHYTLRRIPPRGNSYSFGNATHYSPFNTFRDTMASVGVFLDTGGYDIYDEIDPEDEEVAANLVRIDFGDGTSWRHYDTDYILGYGLDLNFYTGLQEIPESEE